ncbi:MAG: SUMF1/EgtB/PvdO family nonheme iron enzyme [Muribaculaceae bacterium]|nr:SUMF1/EgtB/PvdO family nonheme iron enzyme [Muribaculaceae bacterium]
MHKIININLVALLTFILLGCSSESDILNDPDDALQPEPKTCRLTMEITKSNFSDEPETRSAEEWKNGDTVYLIFDTSNGTTYGDAVYNNGSWQLTYFGSLVTGATTKCLAVYVDNPGSEMGSVIVLNSASCIYEDSEADYIYDGGDLTVSATLSPKTGRIRFQGENNKKLNLYGISCYTAFDTSNGNYTLTSDMLSMQVEGTYTDYIYGMFTDSEEPRVNVIYSDAAFTKQFSNTIYKAGESGYVDLPTVSSHSGWRNHAVFNINGVDLVMIPVEYEEGNFLLAETETTEELYYAVTQQGESSLLPKSGLSSTDWNSFCTTLYKNYRLNFRVPTLKEWQFAFKGGNKSQGFTYSGSNNIYDVAWFNGNSDGQKHPVKQLLPNELGFYDMSGNIWEAVQNYSYYGGYYNSSASECTASSYVYSSPNGLRLAISNN